MKGLSATPYIFNSVYQWLVDDGIIPYVLLDASKLTSVPASSIQNGQLVLNISFAATGQQYFIDKDIFSVSCSIQGVKYEIVVPLDRITSLYGKDTENGFNFTVGRLHHSKKVGANDNSKPAVKKPSLKLV